MRFHNKWYDYVLGFLIGFIILFNLIVPAFYKKEEDFESEIIGHQGISDSIGEESNITILTVNPQDSIVSPNENFTVDVYCYPSQPIKGYEFNLTFDPTLLQVTDVVEGDIGVVVVAAGLERLFHDRCRFLPAVGDEAEKVSSRI